jgi:hypothetical protein
MAKWKCNSCGETYSDTTRDGSSYEHVCSPEVFEHAVCDNAGNVITPAKSSPRPSIRDERLVQGTEYVEGKPMRLTPDPETPGRMFRVPAELAIRSEGLGRTLVE